MAFAAMAKRFDEIGTAVDGKVNRVGASAHGGANSGVRRCKSIGARNGRSNAGLAAGSAQAADPALPRVSDRCAVWHSAQD